MSGVIAALALTASLGCHRDRDDDGPAVTDSGTTGPTGTGDVACAELDAGEVVPFTVAGQTRGAGNDTIGACGGAGEDVTVGFRAPEAGDYLFDTHLSRTDTVLYALAGCGGAELGCDDDEGLADASHLVVSLRKGQGVVLVVDGPAGGGPFVLTGTRVAASETACADGFDDDADQLVDCVDPDCAGASCDLACPELDADGFPTEVAGDTTGGADAASPSCSLGPSSDRSIRFEAPTAGRYGFAIGDDAPFDSVLAVLQGCGGRELACADLPDVSGEAVAVDLDRGEQVTVVVDGFAGDYGPFTVAVFAPTDSEADCADGIDDDVDGWPDCRDPDCAFDLACVEDCADGIDDDGDAIVDCDDPDCQSDAACPEDCADGQDQDYDFLVDCADPGCDFDPACPEDCANDADDDGDGRIDCDDGACAALAECGAGCPDLVLAGPGTVTGSTVGAPDLLAPSCGGPGAPERTIAFTPAETAIWVFDTVGSSFDTVLSLLDDCGGSEFACDDDAPDTVGPSLIAVPITAGDTVVAVVDGLDGAQGDFALNVAKAPDDELDCRDGLDDDYDGFTDCADPGCAGEMGCGTCPDQVLNGALPIVATGTTSGTSAFSGTCGYGTSPDRSFAFTAPSAGDYSFSSAGSSFDTVLYVLDSCSGPELACNDDAGGSTSEVLVPLAAGQQVIVVLDGYGGAAGAYRLTVQ